MGMSIEESISELKWVRKVNEEILKTDAKEIDVNSAWIEHWKKVVKSLDIAIETMRKYQKMQGGLDKIRAEIEEKADGSVGEIADGLYDALEIIDKYKAKNEPQESEDKE